MDFNVTYRLNQKDFLAFNLHRSRLRLIIVPLVFIVIVTAAFLWARFSPAAHSTFSNLPVTYIVYIMAIIVIMPFINTMMIRRVTTRQFRTVVYKDITLELNTEGLKYSGAFGESRLSWADMFRVSESSSGVYFYFSAAQAVIVPKRAISPAQRETLLSLCRAHLTPQKCRLKRTA